MSRGQSSWLCLLLLVLLLFFCVSRQAPMIEQDLSERSRLALDADNMTWAGVIVEGRELTLTGKAPSAEQRQRASETAGSVWGVRNIDNQLEVSGSAQADAPQR